LRALAAAGAGTVELQILVVTAKALLPKGALLAAELGRGDFKATLSDLTVRSATHQRLAPQDVGGPSALNALQLDLSPRNRDLIFPLLYPMFSFFSLFYLKTFDLMPENFQGLTLNSVLTSLICHLIFVFL